jgi:hypothetical protein
MTVLFYAKHSEALTINTTSMAQLAKSSKVDQDAMLSLTRAAKNDSGIMKLIAVVTMIYLPSSLITVGYAPQLTSRLRS